MRALIAPQEFKGSLSAGEAARAIAAGVLDALPDAEAIEAPMSDGGPDLVDTLLAALGGERVEAACHDPLMRPIRAVFGVTSSGVAVIEMAAASGLILLGRDELNPLIATTFGTGELILAALDRGCRSIILGVGGSATVDGGAGAAQALGAHLLAHDGRELPPGGEALLKLSQVDVSGLDVRLRGATIQIASDVRNTLYGAAGAAEMFGPQKGASPHDVRVLDDALRQLSQVLQRDCGVDVSAVPGSGGAGGLGAALLAIAGATIESGFNLVAEATRLREKIASADVVITGEGRLDAQTAYGKTAAGVAAMARAAGKPTGVIAGFVDPGYAADGEFDEIEELKQTSTSMEEAMSNAHELARAAATRLVIRLANRIPT